MNNSEKQGNYEFLDKKISFFTETKIKFEPFTTSHK